jgi:tetratricopeptide (TPR) repeat protein
VESLTAGDPANQQYEKALVESIAWVADAQVGEWHIDDSIAKRERQVALIDDLRRRYPADVEYTQKAIPAQRALGRLLVSRGESEAGLKRLRSAVATGQQLIPMEPDNMVWVQLTAGAQLDLAKVLLVLGNGGEAAAQTRAACDLVDRLSGSDLSAVELRSLQIECLTQRARLALESGARGEALDLSQRALAAARANHGGDPIAQRISVASAYKLVGDVQNRFGDKQAADASWRAALVSWPLGIAETPRQSAIRASILQALGRAADAKPITDKLSTIGYGRII